MCFAVGEVRNGCQALKVVKDICDGVEDSMVVEDFLASAAENGDGGAGVKE